MADSFRTVENWSDYTFGCPEGKWSARLDNKAWGKGKAQNLILYFSEIGTDQKFWFSVFWNKNYGADDGGGPNFKTEVEPGAVLELTTAKSARTGNPQLKTAVLVRGD